MNKEHALSLIKTPKIVPYGSSDSRFAIEIVIDGTVYSTQYANLEFITQQFAVLTKILEAINNE